MNLPVFTYHRLMPADKVRASFDFSSETFRSHLEILKEDGLRTISTDEISKDEIGRAVMVTFDDGYESDHHTALPILKDFGFKAVTFITVNLVDTPGYLTWGKIRDLAKSGFSVQSHCLNHSFLTAMSKKEMLNELIGSRKMIEDRTGLKVEYVSAPGGRVSDEVIEAAASAGYSGIFNSRPGYTPSKQSGILVVNRFVLKNSISPGEFRKMANADGIALMKASMVYSAKGFYRRALGKR